MPTLMLLQTTTLDRLTFRITELLEGSGQAVLAFLLALIVVLIGWVLALAIGRLVLLVLRAARFNDGVRGLFRTEGGPLRHEPAQLASWFAQWTIVVLAVMLGGDILGFDLTRSVGDRLRDVMPRVMAATIVLAAGVAIAMLLGGVTRGIFAGAGFRNSRLRGQVVTIVLTGFTVLLALEQLGLAAQFIIALGLTAVAALGLAAGLSFGLGCRDLARDFVIEYLRSLEEEGPQRPLR